MAAKNKLMEMTLLKFFIPKLIKISRVGGTAEKSVRANSQLRRAKPIFIGQ